MQKIGELNTLHGTFEIKYDKDDKYNPYKLYTKWYDSGKDNGYTFVGYHRKLLAKYADLHGVTNAINEFVRQHDETRREVRT